MNQSFDIQQRSYIFWLNLSLDTYPILNLLIPDAYRSIIKNFIKLYIIKD